MGMAYGQLTQQLLPMRARCVRSRRCRPSTEESQVFLYLHTNLQVLAARSCELTIPESSMTPATTSPDGGQSRVALSDSPSGFGGRPTPLREWIALAQGAECGDGAACGSDWFSNCGFVRVGGARING